MDSITEASPAWTIRRCTADDAGALALVGAATFLETYAGWLPGADILTHCQKAHSAATYSTWLQAPTTAAWLGEARGAPVGYLLLTAPEMPPELVRAGDTEMKRLYLLHRFQGCGLAQALFQAALQHAHAAGARRMLVGLHPDNRRAMAFYQRQDFARIGGRHFQVGTGVYEDPVLARTL